MEYLENNLKELIIQRYGSLKKFTEIIEIPWSTLDSVLKRGISNSNISNVIKICRELNISVDEIVRGKITPSDGYENHDNLPPDIRAAARGMMNLSPEDQEMTKAMIKRLSDKGREALDS